MALSIFHPAETCQRAADVGSIADVIEEPCEEKKEGKTHHGDTEPHGLHANGDHKKEEGCDRHARVEGGKSCHKARNRSRGSDQRRSRTDHHLQDATADAAEEIKKNEAPRSQDTLEDVSGEPEPHHVDGQMEDSCVQKLVGNELPKHSLGEARSAQAEETINDSLLLRGQDFGEDKNQNIQADEGLYGRELDVSEVAGHGGKLLAGQADVDKAGTGAADQDFPRRN